MLLYDHRFNGLFSHRSQHNNNTIGDVMALILFNCIIYGIVTAQLINPPTLTMTKQFNVIEFNFASIDIILPTHLFILLSI